MNQPPHDELHALTRLLIDHVPDAIAPLLDDAEIADGLARLHADADRVAADPAARDALEAEIDRVTSDLDAEPHDIDVDEMAVALTSAPSTDRGVLCGVSASTTTMAELLTLSRRYDFAGPVRETAIPAIPASRTAHRAVDVLELPTVPRILSPDDRAKTSARITRMRELLAAYPVGHFTASGSAMILDTVAAMSEAVIEDRDARSALRLMQTASPHLRALGRHDQRGFRVRRAWAAARSELGHFRTAERLLRRLRDDEQRVMNFVEPWTEIHLQWTLVRCGDLPQAAEGFQTLSTGLAARPDDIDFATLGHLECRWNWVRGLQGDFEEAAKGYRGVIEGRSAVLGPDDPETLDARQSLGAMLELNGQPAQALSILESLLEDRKRVLGSTHVDTLETWKSVCLARFRAEPRSDRLSDVGVILFLPAPPRPSTMPMR